MRVNGCFMSKVLRWNDCSCNLLLGNVFLNVTCCLLQISPGLGTAEYLNASYLLCSSDHCCAEIDSVACAVKPGLVFFSLTPLPESNIVLFIYRDALQRQDQAKYNKAGQ